MELSLPLPIALVVKTKIKISTLGNWSGTLPLSKLLSRSSSPRQGVSSSSRGRVIWNGGRRLVGLGQALSRSPHCDKGRVGAGLDKPPKDIKRNWIHTISLSFLGQSNICKTENKFIMFDTWTVAGIIPKVVRKIWSFVKSWKHAFSSTFSFQFVWQNGVKAIKVLSPFERP